MHEHDLLATSWTWAGDEPIADRVRAVGDAGFAGLSLSLDDLHEVRATTGFAALRRVLDRAGIVWVQLGPLDRWWSHDGRTTDDDADRGVVLEAAATLSAWQVVVRADPGVVPTSPASMTADWIELATQAGQVGAQLVLEPEPWSNLPTIERASRFVATAGHPNGGLLLDAMHTLRGGSTLASVAQGVSPAVLAAVELSDGLLHTPSGLTLAEESRSARHLPEPVRGTSPAWSASCGTSASTSRGASRSGRRHTGRCPSPMHSARPRLRRGPCSTRPMPSGSRRRPPCRRHPHRPPPSTSSRPSRRGRSCPDAGTTPTQGRPRNVAGMTDHAADDDLLRRSQESIDEAKAAAAEVDLPEQEELVDEDLPAADGGAPADGPAPAA